MEKIITAKKLGIYIIIIIIIFSLRNLATDKQDNNNMAASRCPRGSCSFNHTLSGLARYATVWAPTSDPEGRRDSAHGHSGFLHLESGHVDSEKRAAASLLTFHELPFIQNVMKNRIFDCTSFPCG